KRNTPHQDNSRDRTFYRNSRGRNFRGNPISNYRGSTHYNRGSFRGFSNQSRGRGFGYRSRGNRGFYTPHWYGNQFNNSYPPFQTQNQAYQMVPIPISAGTSQPQQNPSPFPTWQL
ncbi:unnamed protein product, partial [Nesidiocoris tenuis]